MLRNDVLKLLTPLILIVIVAAYSPAHAAYPLVDTPRSMTTQFTFTAIVPAPNPPGVAEPVDIWLPIPSDGPWQTVTGVRIAAPASYQINTEQKYGDHMVYVHLDHPAYPVTISATFTVTRTEPRVLGDKSDASTAVYPDDTAPDRLVPTGGLFFDIATNIVGTDSSPLSEEDSLFRSVVADMTYDYKKTSPEYAMGDSAFVCDYKSGNCSDLHSYLTSLSRSVGIPAVIEFGFPLTGIPVPATIPTDGSISGYHCWTWFKAGGRWLPEDAADARRWQDIDRPDVRDYLFGNLLLPRCAVAVSRGRDIVLQPAQKGPPLNYFIYPYAESDGNSVPVKWSITYHVVSPP